MLGPLLLLQLQSRPVALPRVKRSVVIASAVTPFLLSALPPCAAEVLRADFFLCLVHTPVVFSLSALQRP